MKQDLDYDIRRRFFPTIFVTYVFENEVCTAVQMVPYVPAGNAFLPGKLPVSVSEPSAYAVEIRGKVFEPRFKDGSFLVISDDAEPNVGDKVFVFYLDGVRCAVFGRLLDRSNLWVKIETSTGLVISLELSPLDAVRKILFVWEPPEQN